MAFHKHSGIFWTASGKFLALLKHFPGQLTLVFWLLCLAPLGATDLRVAIKKGNTQVKVGSSTTAIVRDHAGRKLGEISPMTPLSVKTGGRGVVLDRFQAEQLIIEPTEDGYVWIGDGWYRGQTHLIRQGKGVTAVNQIDLEEYLYSVVGAEAIPSWPQEALKAQAVAARTYALYKTATSRNSFYDLDPTTQTQVYKGLKSEYLSTHEAVKSTAGQIMTYNGKTILAAFHASSGGHTENVEDVWTSPLPYLRGVVDYDQQAPVFQWRKTFSASELGRLIGGVGTVRSMVPRKTTPNGRIISMKVVGDRGSKEIEGAQLRKSLTLRSTLFTVSGANGTFAIDGRGSGHGIGLSQWGAYYLSQQGIDYQRILGHYYQNANLGQISSQ